MRAIHEAPCPDRDNESERGRPCWDLRELAAIARAIGLTAVCALDALVKPLGVNAT